MPEVLGAPGLVLVDTPGLGSVHEHRTAAAQVSLVDSDGAIVVLSVDSPLSAAERALVAEIAARAAPLFVVVDKAHHVSSDELDTVRRYLADQLAGLVDHDRAPYFVSARRALERGRAGAGDVGFDAFASDLARFVREDLAAARFDTAARELRRLGDHLSAAFEMERAAAELDAQCLQSQLSHFEQAAAENRRQFDGDRVVLEHATDELARSVAAQLTEGARQSAASAWLSVTAAAGTASAAAPNEPSTPATVPKTASTEATTGDATPGDAPCRSGQDRSDRRSHRTAGRAGSAASDRSSMDSGRWWLPPSGAGGALAGSPRPRRGGRRLRRWPSRRCGRG